MELPDDWVDPFPSESGFVWDNASDPNPANGHSFAGFAYNPQGVFIDSWGLQGRITDSAIAKYANSKVYGGLYTAVSMDSINQAAGTAPNGFDWSQLIADFDSMGGNAARRALLGEVTNSRHGRS